MNDAKRDRQLGMHVGITRRDWLNGLALTLGAELLGCQGRGKAGSAQVGSAQVSATAGAGARAPLPPGPPALVGVRGSHEGAFEAAHRLRDGAAWDGGKPVQDTGERYDLVIVGAGLSGLAAAYLYRRKLGPQSKILLLDNHDDFGGHARRNEFRVDERLLITNGGTQSFSNPHSYSPEVKQLLAELGIRFERFETAFDQRLHAERSTAFYFDRETFGEPCLRTGMNERPWAEFLANTPLSDQVRRDIVRLYTDKRDYLAGRSLLEKERLLKRTSYADYLTRYCKLAPKGLAFFQTFTHDLFCVGIDAVSAWSCLHASDDYEALVYPGFSGLGFPPPEENGPYIHHFPDGGASVARLFVRSLLPGRVTGHDMEDIVTAEVDYAGLDREDSPVRLRLKSTVTRVQHRTDNSGLVDVAYEAAGQVRRVTGKKCILACYNSMIPYLCPELPEPQKQAQATLVKMPLIYTHVALRTGESFAHLGIRHIVSPGSYHSYTSLDFPVSLGDYHFPSRPEDPAVLFMLRTPCKVGLTRREQNRVGRWEMLGTPFEVMERRIRQQLQSMLGAGGFDAARDIKAITVNRWAHGYSFSPNRLFDPEWVEQKKPWIVGRQRHGNIAIANSDAGARAYLDVALEQAARAVEELCSAG